MKIVLAGDSWGIGVFEHRDGNYGPTGQGIQSLLENLGHEVINISQAGGSNWLIVERLQGQWAESNRYILGANPPEIKSFDLAEVNCIIFLQTDIFRERHYYVKEFEHSTTTQWKALEPEFVDGLLNYSSIKEFTERYFAELYETLNSIALQYNKKVLCIGGWSKLHPSITQFKNLIPVLYSATQMLISELEQDDYISDSEWFLQLDKHPKIMVKFGSEIKAMAIANAEKMDKICRSWNEVHPSLEGYQKIVDYIIPELKE